jgi:hypothetical protein
MRHDTPYDPARPFAPWLVAIANHRLIDRLRRQRRARSRETALVPDHETFATDQANRSEQAVERPDLQQAAAKLPSGQRQAIRLLKLEEKSLNEAVAISGMTVASLKVATQELAEDPRRRRRGFVITTPDLIDSLVRGATPIRRLRPPLVRALGWLLLAAVILGLLAISQGIRPDLLRRLPQSDYAVGLSASFFTGVCAAIAAFMLSLPDRSRLWVFMPAPALFSWLSTIGFQCLTNWVTLDPSGMRFGETARCFATLVLTSLPLSLAMLVMLRYAAPMRPTTATLTGSLAVAAITATALSLFHDLDAAVMILIWNLGTATVMVGLGGFFFSWVVPRSNQTGR